MAARAFVIFAGQIGWRIGVASAGDATITDVPVADATSTSQIAAAVAKALATAGYRGEGALLALPSAWCLAATIATQDLPPSDRKAMLFRLEEKLPLAAEGIVADFIAGADAATALGVCTRVDRLAPLVNALESAGVVVQSIAPAALLAVQAVASERDAGPRIILCGEEAAAPAIDVIQLDAGRVTSWALVPAELPDLKLQLDMMAARSGATPPMTAISLDAAIAADLSESIGQMISVREDSTSIAAARGAAESLNATRRPWVEFRRGPLAARDRLRRHRKPLDALLAAAAVLLLAIGVACFARGERYAHQAESSDAELVQAFRAQFPGWSVPANVKAVIDSEHRKRTAGAGGALPAEARLSALQTMHAVLSRLPADGRYSIEHMTFEDASFEIVGRLGSYEQVDALAAAGRLGGFTVPPPQTRRNDDGSWAFTLRGTRANKDLTAAIQ